MAETSTGKPFIIRGMTHQGRPFRPSDWAERLAGAFSIMEPDHRMCYSPYVQPTTHEGIRCVLVDRQMKTDDPTAYRFLQAFAKSNDLVTENDD